MIVYMDDPSFNELVRIRESVERLEAKFTGFIAKPPALRRGWLVAVEVATFFSAIVALIVYIIDYLWR
jgi:hypothetical protein